MSREEQLEKIVFKLLRAIVISIITFVAALLVTNAMWLWAWMQYDYVGEETTITTGEGEANYIGRNGSIG